MEFDEAPELRTLREAARGLLTGLAAPAGPGAPEPDQIGRASCRERV